MRSPATFVLALSFAAAVTGNAVAADAPNADAKRHAEESFGAGLRDFDSAERSHDPKLYDEAYYEFIKAFAIYPEDKTLWNLALAEVESGRAVDGLRHLREYDRHQHVTDQPSHPKNKLMREYMERASQVTAHAVISAPAGVPVRVDGHDAGIAPLVEPVDFAPGDHVVEALLADGPHSESVHAPVGQTVEVQFAPAPAPVAAPAASFPPPAAAAALPPEATGSTWWTPPREAGVTLGGLAVAGLVVGLVMHGVSNSNADHVDALRGSLVPGSCANGNPSASCVDLHDSLNAANHDATFSTVSFVVAGAAAIGGIALVVFGDPPKHPQRGAIEWAPIVSPWGAGMRGSF